MLNEFAKIKYYVVAVLVALCIFMWAGLTGTRLLGDDNESSERTAGAYNRSGHSGGGHGHGASRFYHK